MRDHGPLLSSLATAAAAAVTAVGATLIASYCMWQTQQRRTQALEEEWSKKRQEERTGRIRAEVKLRNALKDLQRLQQLQAKANKSNGRTNRDPSKDAEMLLQCIGTVVSPYTKRMGTPRQPQLAPASRGYIQFTVQAATLSGIEQYSHIWVIFEFHANTDTNASKKTKIRPPRAPQDTKVGQLATRSPHRPNPLGLSLVKLERWDEKARQLHVAGLDLVNNTPVYDIKPVVPWDIPGFPAIKVPCLTAPSWVVQDDVIPAVQFEQSALNGLRDAVNQGKLAPLYTNSNGGFEAAQQTLLEILAQDPRSSHKGLTENARGSSSGQIYKLIFCETEVSFLCQNDAVTVTEVRMVEFDDSQYVDGVPLISNGTC